jgi:hypothetical protein
MVGVLGGVSTYRHRGERTMSPRRLAAAAVTAGALVAAWPAGAATSRTVSLAYQGAASVQGVVSGAVDGQTGHVGYVQLPTSRKERTVSVSVTDARGLPVAFQLSQGNTSDSATMTDLGEWCASTPHAVRLPHPGQPVVVYLELGICGTSPSAPTTGTVKLTVR